ncbi:DNA cytosine methyltransferase [Brunnivagina elsteri]|uniref:DNA cytosine methyltransferase n=1 Tax=Brunnivagina elsteri TaxID=1247191 RepID=UPI001FEA405E|nr:DNA (cytosine-5-)-methyltransferase [Calothrix elsteri]
MEEIRFVDLFSGIGGIRLGFEQAAQSMKLKTKCVLSSEINSDARLVYEANFSDVPLGANVATGIIPSGKLRDVREILELPEHDVLLAGFPCQSFSYAGKKEGFGDTRGTLFFEIVRLIDSCKPKAFIFENVRGLYAHENGKTLETIKHEMLDI